MDINVAADGQCQQIPVINEALEISFVNLINLATTADKPFKSGISRTIGKNSRKPQKNLRKN
jgi:hypothetical protein